MILSTPRSLGIVKHSYGLTEYSIFVFRWKKKTAFMQQIV